MTALLKIEISKCTIDFAFSPFLPAPIPFRSLWFRVSYLQQHPPPPLFAPTGLLVNFTPDLSLVGADAILFLICAAMVMKACSTLSAFLADVSRNSMPKLSANSWMISGTAFSHKINQ